MTTNRFPEWDDYEDGTYFFFIGERALGYYPEVDASQTMRIYYLRKPRQFNLANQVRNKATSYDPLDDEDDIPLPSEQIQPLLDWILWRAFERLGDREEANQHRSQYAYAKREFEAHTRNANTVSVGESPRGISFGNKGI